MTDPLMSEIDRLVAEAEVELVPEVWVAIRATGRHPGCDPEPGVAFMGTFTTEEAAKRACQDNCSRKTLEWTPRGARNQWKASGMTYYYYSVALIEVKE